MTFKKGDIVRVNGRRGTIHSELPTMPGHEPFYYVQFLPFTPLDLIPAHMIQMRFQLGRKIDWLGIGMIAAALLVILSLIATNVNEFLIRREVQRLHERIDSIDTAKESR